MIPFFLLVVIGHAVRIWFGLIILFDELLEFASLNEFPNLPIQFMTFINGMTITFMESAVLPKISAFWPRA